MEGLYYYHDYDEISFIQFYEDGRAMFFGKSIRFGHQFTTSNWVKIESDKVVYLYGRYWIGDGNRIKIKLVGEFRLEYRGRIMNIYTLELIYRCQYTNSRKVVTFRRFSERKHLVYTQLQKRL